MGETGICFLLRKFSTNDKYVHWPGKCKSRNLRLLRKQLDFISYGSQNYALVGFRYGGAQGAGIGKAIGGVIKTGDLDFQKALSDFGTGWSLGKVGEGFGLESGGGIKSIFGE